MKQLNEHTFEAQSWNDIQEELFNFEKDDKHGRFRSPLAYRGVDCASYFLETSLMRTKNPSAEQHLLRNFKKYANAILKSNNNVWELLAVAQHYGLPTRLLDWTFSPYVALHFATSNLEKFDKDGAIWCLDIEKVHTLLPESLKEILKDEDSYVFTVDLLAKVPEINELKGFDKLKGDTDFIVCLEPPSIDERIINQYAMFTVMSNALNAQDDLLNDYPGVYKKLIIPSTLKWEIRDKLDQANISERMIYPGLQGISAWLKRYYTKI